MNPLLAAAIEKIKKSKEAAALPKHEAWVPAPEKEKAKELGVKWNSEAKRYEFGASIASMVNDDHPCARYLPANFTKLKAKVPYDAREDFKALGIVSTVVDGVWGDYVMIADEYKELIEALMEIELL